MSDASSTPSRPHSPVSAVPELISKPRPYRFNWDTASHRGPESVSGTTEGRGDYFNTHPPLGFLNTSSTSLDPSALPTEWSSSRHGFHAISTVLNNPHKRQAPPKAHSALPPTQPAELPRVRRKDFDTYLRAIASEWDRYERNVQLGREGQAQLDFAQARLSTSNETPITPLRTGPIPKVQGRDIPPLDSVPSVFFQTNFNLGDPRTFNAVTEQDPTSSLSLNAITTSTEELNELFSVSHFAPLLENFSHYADTVEQHLVREISLRSTSFFAALTNLHDLQAESEQCLDRIARLRGLLRDVDVNGAKRGLEMVRRECKMANLARVREGVRMVGSVVEMTGVARSLVTAGQWGEALNMIEEMERLWEVSVPNGTTGVDGKAESRNGVEHGQKNSLVLPATPEEQEDVDERTPIQNDPKVRKISPSDLPLSSLRAFSALPNHLRLLTLEIATSLSSELVSILKSDLADRIGVLDGRKDRALDQNLRDKLRPLLEGLVKTKSLKEGILSWREVALQEVNGVIKRRLDNFDLDDDNPNSTSHHSSASEGRAGLANHMREMSQSDFMILIQGVYRSLLNGVEGLQSQRGVISEVLETIKLQTPSIAAATPALEEELTDILSSAAELSNTQAAKVISYRSEQHAALELPDFLTFFNDSWTFVVKCEVICRRMIVGLRGTVVNQAKSFLQQFHQARLTRSAKIVEDELWKLSDVSPALQHITNILIDSAMRDSPELIIKSEDTVFSSASSEPPATSSENGTSSSNQPLMSPKANHTSVVEQKNNGTSSGGKNHRLRIEERTYYMVAATDAVLTLLVDYLKIIVNVSLLTMDTMSRVIEFLRAFNSRTCQVVLGAGAMRSAGLRNITARHLALASQSLSIISELIPYVREMFRRHLSQRQAVMLVEFDKLKRDFQDHQNEIHTKLISIMGDRLDAHIKTLQGVDWHVPKPDGGVNSYMEVLVKETVTLHNVLSRYLATPIVEYVMTQVFAAINHRLSEEYGKIELPNQEAKARLLADARYLHQSLSALKNVTAPTGMLETVITELGIPRANPAPAVAAPTRSSSLSTSANMRLRGLLSGRSNTQAQERVLPATPSTPIQPQPPLPPSPSASTQALNGLGLGIESSASGSSLGISMSPQIQSQSTLSLPHSSSLTSLPSLPSSPPPLQSTPPFRYSTPPTTRSPPPPAKSPPPPVEKENVIGLNKTGFRQVEDVLPPLHSEPEHIEDTNIEGDAKETETEEQGQVNLPVPPEKIDA